MNRSNGRIVGGIVALIVIVVGVWFLKFRGGGGDEPVTDDKGRTGKSQISARDRAKVTGRTVTGMQWSLDPEPEGPLRLEGQVLGPDGKGVGGAEVWLASVPPRSTKTEDDGTFSFDKLVGRMYSLRARAGDLIGGPTPYKLTAKGDPAVIRLFEAAAITVIVVDEAQQPISRANVRVHGMDDPPKQTDVKGAVTIKPVRPGYVTVQATAAGYAPNTGFASVGTSGITGRITVVLHKGFAVAGRVIDDAGKAIAGAHVYASGGEWQADWTLDDAGQEDSRSRHDVVTNDKGEFAIPALGTGPHTLSAVDGEHMPGRTPITVDGRPLSGVEITMKTGGVVAGVVVDTAKKPVAFVPVRIAGTGTQWSIGRRQAVSDKDGKFEVRGLVRAKLQARAESDTAASKLVEIDLTTVAEKRGVELVLDVSGTISGIVVDDTGKPVPEVHVKAFPDVMGGASTDALALADMSSEMTDGAGRFTLHGLPDGAYRLWASRGEINGSEWNRQGTVAKTGDTDVKLTLPATGTLTGKIVIAGASAPKLARVHVGYQAPVPTTDGAFTIKDLTPGKYHVVFRGPEFADLDRPIEILPGKTNDLGTITVHRGRRLVGKVTDSSGQPVANAKVKLAEILYTAQTNVDQAESWEEIAGVRATVSDQSGEFVLIGISPKSTNAMAEAAGGRSLAVEIPAGTEDPPPVALALRGFGSISGRVTLKGAPQPNVSIAESSKDGGAQASFATTDDNGNFTLQKVPEGAHILHVTRAQGMSFKSTQVNADVTTGRDTKVEIEIPVGTITLAVTFKALPGHKVDAAQTFLFAGPVIATNLKQMTDSAFKGGLQGMKIWLGGAMPPPEFEELVAGEYSICTVPITGNIADPALQQQLQTQMQLLKVYCKQVRVTPAPTSQKVTHELPSMDPLPKPPS